MILKTVKRDITISTNITPTAISVIITCLNVTTFVEPHVTGDYLSLFSEMEVFISKKVTLK